MSLVEKALNKMKQDAARAGAADPKPAEDAPKADRPVGPPPAAHSAAAPHAATPPPHAPPHVVTTHVAPPHVATPRAAPPQAPAAQATAGAAEQRLVLQIDPDTLRKAGYFPPIQQERELIEQYRHIKRPLVARALGRGGNGRDPRASVIMVTSALPQEGKTFTTINLTRSFALEKDATVLLVDADVANPQATRVIGADGAPGLIDALGDDSIDVASLVLETNVPGVQVLPVGCATDLGAELIGSQRMGDLIDRLIEVAPNRIILLDSAPLLVTNEGKALIHVAGQVVLVVQAHSTPQHAVLEAAELFGEDQYVGVVLNQCEEAVGLGYGYYAGTYNYGSYGYGRKDRQVTEPG
jgi:protein-tyrosine kinase